MVDIELLTHKYFSLGKPCPYKLKCDAIINIYPIKVSDWVDFEDCIDILKFDKNTIPDANVVAMSQLQYLESVRFKDEREIAKNISYGYNEMQKFKQIFHICLHEDYVGICQDENGKYIIIVGEYDKENELTLKYKITNKEYLEIVKIILFQNIYDYDDRDVSQDVIEQYNEYMRLKHKDMHNPTLEEQIIYVISKYKCSIDVINDMTYRMFSMLYNSYLDMDMYRTDMMYKTAYKFDVKENISHPLFAKKKDKYDELFISKDALSNKLGN